jgi:hypothetical protein
MKSKFIYESLNFERGQDPKQSMDIGHFAKINKITSSDLELLKIYTNNGDGKGYTNEELFLEVYESSASCEKYLERAKEVYKLLEPYEYLFGDNFEADMKKEMNQYIKSYLKNPKYNYAYNCDIMEEGDFDVFFCEIELPSAEILAKVNKKMSESVNFERGVDPKSIMDIGVISKIKKILNDFNYRTEHIRYAGIIERTPYQSNLPNEGSDDVWIYIHYQNNGSKEQFDRDTEWADKYIDYRSFIRGTHEIWPTGYARIKPEYKELFLKTQSTLRESYNFERGQEPKSAMEIGRWKEILREKILSTDPDLGKMTEMGWMITKDYWAGDFMNPDKTKTEWNWDALNSLTPEGFKELERQLNKVKASLKESLNFERGIEPKDAILGPKYRMFSIVRHKMLNSIKDIAQKYNAEVIDESTQELLKIGVITPIKKGKIFIELGREDLQNPGTHIHDMGVGYYLPDGTKTSGIGVSVGEFKEGLEKYEYELQEAIRVVEKWLNQDTTVKESLDFERGVNPKQTLGIGVKEKIRQGILGLLQSSRGDSKISTINIGKNREDLWLDISDYGTKNFEDLFYSFLSPEYFRNEIYLRAKPKKFSNSWKDDWRVFIKDEYKDFFKACFSPEGYIIESVNFERGGDPKDRMSIGRVEERKRKVIDQIIDYDPSNWTGSSVLAPFIEGRFSITKWDVEKMENSSIDEIQDLLNHIKKWERIEKNEVEKRLRRYNKVGESINFERGLDPKTSMKIGGIRPVDQLKKDYDNIVELIQTQKYLDFQVPFTGEADDLIEPNIHFGWGNIQNNFKNMNREELYPFEILVQKYTKLLGI